MKIKFKKIFCVISSIVCVSGLLFQSSQLFSQYMSGKSVVNIEVKRELYANLPAITICYPEIVSMELAANYSDIYRHYYEKYKQIFELAKTNSKLYGLFEKNMTSLFKGFKSRLNNEEMDQLFRIVTNNISLPYKQGNNSFINISMKGGLYKTERNYSILKKKMYSNSSYNYNDDPIETYNIKKRVKCFTFFSFLNPNWTDVKIDLDFMRITIDNDVNWFPPHIITKFYLAIHSPKIIPEFRLGLEFVELLPNADYYVPFAKIHVDRYIRETNSNCKDYSKNDYRKLRSDCIVICLLRKLHDNNIRFGPSKMTTLLRKEHANYMERPWHNYTNYQALESMTNMTQTCHRMCKHDCKYSYYFYDAQFINDLSPHSLPTVKKAFITLQHNRLPDIFVRHIPGLTFISFVGNFGGLLGMWLGINAIMIFDDAFKLTIKVMAIIRQNKHFKNSYVQNNLFIKRMYHIHLPNQIS